jgi:hypothetical protein
MNAPRARLHVLEVLGRGDLGPMELHVLRITEGLQDGGVRVSAVCPSEGPAARALHALGCHVLVTPVGDDPAFASVRDVAAHVLDDGVDVLHAHYANAHVLAVLAGAAAALPCLATLHGPNIGMRDLEAHKLVHGAHLHVLGEPALCHARAVGVSARRIHHVGNDAAPVDRPLHAAPGSRVVGIATREGDPGSAPVGRMLATAGCQIAWLGGRRAAMAAGTQPPRISVCIVPDAAALPPRLLDALACSIPVVAGLAGSAGDGPPPRAGGHDLPAQGAGCMVVAATPAHLAQATLALLDDTPRYLALAAEGAGAAGGWPRRGMVEGLRALLQALASGGHGSALARGDASRSANDRRGQLLGSA